MPTSGVQLRRILGKECRFNARGKIDLAGIKQFLLQQLEYPPTIISGDDLLNLIEEQDHDRDGFLDEEEFKEMLVGLGEFE